MVVKRPDLDHDPRMEESPRRIAVIGRAGAGKTTVAQALADALGLPLVHLDRLYWGPAWTPFPAERFGEAQTSAVAADAWVIDGGYLSSPGGDERLRRAQVIVLVKAPLATCLWRIVRRSLARPATRRPDLPDGCGERVSPFFLWWTLGWARRHRDLLDDLRDGERDADLVVVRSAPECAALIRRWSGAHAR